ncbi:hypothetical protein [Elizabethkingia phage TCUEAP3]|nr:hypothetical protein [Elizabethkingia phage TCUEAP3]
MIRVRNNHVGQKNIDIDFGGTITISLYDEQYFELLDALELSMAEKVIDSTQRVITLEKRADNIRVFIKEIREFFYDMDSVFIIPKKMTELDSEKLANLLNNYDDLLGFQ